MPQSMTPWQSAVAHIMYGYHAAPTREEIEEIAAKVYDDAVRHIEAFLLKKMKEREVTEEKAQRAEDVATPKRKRWWR